MYKEKASLGFTPKSKVQTMSAIHIQQGFSSRTSPSQRRARIPGYLQQEFCYQHIFGTTTVTETPPEGGKDWIAI
jgi:hypothetical protein